MRKKVLELVRRVVNNSRNIKNGTTDSNVEIKPEHRLQGDLLLDGVELMALSLLISEDCRVYVSAGKLAEASVRDLQDYVELKSKAFV